MFFVITILQKKKMSSIISDCQIVDIHETKKLKKLVVRYSPIDEEPNSIMLCCEKCCMFFCYHFYI